MLEKIIIKNYKAFEYAEIPIKPITILLGANSVGKSSIIQLLLLLQQTSKEELKSYKSPLKLYGGFINLGDPQNLFHKKDISKPLTLTFELKNIELNSFLIGLFSKDFIDNLKNIPKFIPIVGFSKIRNKEIKNINDFETYLDVYIELLSKDSTTEIYQDELKWFLTERSSINLGAVNQENKPNLLRAYDLLKGLSQLSVDSSMEISFEISYIKNKLTLQRVTIKHSGKLLIEYYSKRKKPLKSQLIKFTSNENEELKTVFDNQNTIFNAFIRHKDENALSTITGIIQIILSRSLVSLQKEFIDDKINYVSPLRAHPKRYYMLDKSKVNLSIDTLDGDAVADVLKDNKSLKKKVNDWLSKFNLAVNVEEFKEVVHHLKVTQNELNLDITDVGFGISQVLPVIIQGFLSSPYSTTIIEQPEIHLHPKMQADLSDLFIDIINNTKTKKLIIETHSEYLLKRLRRRISDSTIPSEEVAICLFNPQTTTAGATITHLEIKQKGFFEWPVDFYGGEILNDTTEFLKNQVS